MGRLKLALALLLLSCGEEYAQPGIPANSRCVDRIGSYLIRLDARTGNCGAVAETIAVLPNPKTSASDCTTTAVLDSNNCGGTVESTCPRTGGGIIYEVAKMSFAKDGSQGNGLMEITATYPGGGVECHGTYDVTWRKI